MVCTQCRDGEHERCEDTQHPGRLYRGCACQHAPRLPVNEPGEGPQGLPSGEGCSGARDDR